MRWFGESWGAPICDWREHAPTPTGQRCASCQDHIARRAQGLLVPHVDVTTVEQPWHLDCFHRSIGIAPPERVVHVLFGCRSLCGLEGLRGPEPCHWPAGHVWVNVFDAGEATCATCRGEMGRRGEELLALARTPS